MLAPKSYAYTLFSKDEPFADKALDTVIKMKGISLRAGIQCALTVPLLEKLALAQLSPRDSAMFREDLEDQGFHDPPHQKGLSNALYIPQPRLTKSLTAFGIFAKDKFAQILRSRFTKRLLRIPRLFKDSKESSDLHRHQPFHPSHYPSLPFGFKSAFLENGENL